MKLPRVEIFQGVNDDGEYNGQFYWRLRAANNEIVATGEAYTSREDAKRGFIDAASTFNEAVIEWFCSSFGKKVMTEAEVDKIHSDGFRQGLGPEPSA